MRNVIRSIKHFAIYLLPVSLLTVAGALLIALLYYPVTPAQKTYAPQANVLSEQEFWQAYTEVMFAMMLADALRELHAEQEGQVQTLMYRYEYGKPTVQYPQFEERAPLIWL